MDIFGDKNQNHVKALAFTIKASNPFNRAGKINWVSAMQSIEYIKAGWTKMLQSQLGSALYAHGAISLWEKDIMLSVFKAHNTFFDGEDLQMGVILHAFNQGYAIKTVGNVSVETEVPSHSICWNWNSEKAREQYPIPIFHDIMRLIFVAPLKCGGWGCGYNEKSLFRQRVASWDKGAHRAFMWYVQLLLFNWSGSTLALKPYLVYEIWSIFNDWTWPWLMFLFFTSSTGDDVSEFVEWMLMITAVDLVLMSYMNEFKFSDRRDMRSRVIDCISFALYKYVLKVLRIFALVYNLFHYFPRAQTPLVIADRVALPQFIDDSCVFLDEEEGDSEAIREIWVNEDTNEILVMDAKSPHGKRVEEDTALARTAELLQATSDNVVMQGIWKVHRPKHFMLKVDTWLYRRWAPANPDATEPFEANGSLRHSYNAKKASKDGSVVALDDRASLYNSSSMDGTSPRGENGNGLSVNMGSWDVIGKAQDKAGGSGLTHDLQRLTTTVSWARQILAPGGMQQSNHSIMSPNGLKSDKPLMLGFHDEQPEEGDAYMKRIKLQCAIMIGESIAASFGCAAQLREMRKQGQRRSGDKDAMTLMTAQPEWLKLMELLMEEQQGHALDASSKVRDAREASKKWAGKVRNITKSLHPWNFDPEGDIWAVLSVTVSIVLGLFFGLMWPELNGSNAKKLVKDIGLPGWSSDFLWFTAVFSAVMLVCVCSLVCPLTISWLIKGKGAEVPLQKKEKAK